MDWYKRFRRNVFVSMARHWHKTMKAPWAEISIIRHIWLKRGLRIHFFHLFLSIKGWGRSGQSNIVSRIKKIDGEDLPEVGSRFLP